MLLTGYLSKLGCRAGETVDVMVSSTAADVTVGLVRLIHGDENPNGPGFVHEEVDAVAPRLIHAEEQETAIGSYAVGSEVIDLSGDAHVSLALWPTTPDSDREQGLMSLPEAGLSLGIVGRCVVARVGDGLLTSAPCLQAREWFRVDLTVSPASARLRVWALPHPQGDAVLLDEAVSPGVALGSGRPLLAATRLTERQDRTFPEGLYNGKLAAVSLEANGATEGAWAFELDMSSQRAVDVSGHERHLNLVNTPTRAMTGPTWTNRFHAWEQDPAQWNAIHFHDDDLADAGWPVSLELEIPSALPSGVYAVRLQANGAETDYIPLAVRPREGAPHARIAFMLATFTYLAYANEHLTEGDFEQGSEIPVRTGEWEDLVAAHPEWGKSVYDLHNDGSGVAHSSALRPIPNMRPTYRFWGFHAPRRFPADLYVVNFLTQLGEPFDVITEHDLHSEADALTHYQTVITGSHPEYYSGDMLDALDRHVDSGGGLLYLGGDGFYWVTTSVREHPLVIEVRKSEGLRHWDAEPGERHHASTGELGGLWRSRGRSAHRLFGVGMGAHGWDNKAPGYRRTAESYRDDVRWVFEGIEDEVIGDFGLIMNGTSGDEIDRIDHRYGTPRDTVVLASSEPHSQWYVPVPEDVTTVSNQLNGTFNRDVRSDMVLVEREGGGAVFSVGSIIFTGALPVNGGANNAALLVENVIRNFTSRRKRT
ncbi:N,N-dimethylformamidase beta subunit family domain-containing protein [Streptomyces sp. NBC_01716]|uniref:N,N-dimethylformamidase beta subunit family domain-containing protein n=1 Tax=Streptomyces sp. NBC_01716 TaxID=2975917 RepID=UPI002E35D3DF|nr:N,N-dimethylformamidase beta subunit family domain-containing protein [Streptomyces sp. NBC_01716]